MSDIVLLFSDREGRTIIAQSLLPQHEVAFGWPPADAGFDIDLIIADAAALVLEAARISNERKLRDPVLVPVLLLADRRRLAELGANLWQLVDDVALRSLDRGELQTRVESLLRCRERSQSLELAAFHKHERKVTQRFQQAALPRLLPRVPGLTLGAFYRPGMDEAQVGGDWYDALQLADGRVVFSIGDVCGAGLDAAIAM